MSILWIGFVSKGQLESKLLGVERNRSLDVPRADNRVRFFEHCSLSKASARPELENSQDRKRTRTVQDFL